MKSLVSLICCFVPALAFSAGVFPSGTKFAPGPIEIIWKAQTNNLPANVWIYRVVSSDFSPNVISNLMAIGGFTTKDKTKKDGGSPVKDKRFLYFSNKEESRRLSLFGPSGWASYSDDHARSLGSVKAKGVVPTEAEVLKLAVEWAKRLCIDPSNFAKKEGSSELYGIRSIQTQEGFGKPTPESGSEVIMRGVSFVRQIDGMNFTGSSEDGGFSISFGDQGRISDLQLVWRKYERHKLSKASTPSQIIRRIKEGRAKMSPFTNFDVSPGRKLTINKVLFCYLGAGGDESQEFLYPFAALVCKLEAKSGDGVEIILNCPILPEE